MDYNIEIKSEAETDGKFHPKPEEFSDLTYRFIDQYLPWDRVIIQSFDLRVLRYWHKKYPNVKLAFLVDNLKTISENFNALGFVPDIYSPDYKLLDKNEVATVHSRTPSRELRPGQKTGKVRVIPWTVNDEKEMTELKEMGVDGIITDYPDRARNLNLTLRLTKN